MQWSTEQQRAAHAGVDRAVPPISQQEIGVNVWFRQGGYLFLGRSEEGSAPRWSATLRCRTAATCPPGSSAPEEARALVPEAQHRRAGPGASYNPKDGVALPVAVSVGLRAPRRSSDGVEVHLYTEVTGIDHDRRVRADDFTVHHLKKGPISSERVVNAAGAWSPSSSRRWWASSCPIVPIRHEILSTEPLKPFLGARGEPALLEGGSFLAIDARRAGRRRLDARGAQPRWRGPARLAARIFDRHGARPRRPHAAARAGQRWSASGPVPTTSIQPFSSTEPYRRATDTQQDSIHHLHTTASPAAIKRKTNGTRSNQ